MEGNSKLLNLIENWYILADCAGESLFFYQRLRNYRNIEHTGLRQDGESNVSSKLYDYLVKTDMTVKEVCKLIEVVFEYITEIEGLKIFRNRK